jgi:hypothetical protein
MMVMMAQSAHDGKVNKAKLSDIFASAKDDAEMMRRWQIFVAFVLNALRLCFSNMIMMVIMMVMVMTEMNGE